MQKNIIVGWMLLGSFVGDIWALSQGLKVDYEPTAEQVEQRRIQDRCFPELMPLVMAKDPNFKKFTATLERCSRVHAHEKDPLGTQTAKEELKQEYSDAASESDNSDDR